MNAYQKLAAETYGGGDFAHIESEDEVEEAGDTLFTALMKEFSDGEDCESMEMARVRISRMVADLQEVEQAIEDRLADEPDATP